MRRRPFMPPIKPQRMGLEPAMRFYCERRKIAFGAFYFNSWTPPRGGPVAQARLTFGRRHAFWQVKAHTAYRADDMADRLYDNLTRALDRKLRKLGWLT